MVESVIERHLPHGTSNTEEIHELMFGQTVHNPSHAFGFIEMFFLQVMDPFGSVDGSLSSSCQSLDQALDR